MPAPRVSILIPTYNRAHYVGDAVASALAQTLTDIEVIVADDGSSDTTPAVLARFDDPRLRIVRHAHNQGIPTTRNTALEAATGRYIAWLDSDDVARPMRLAEQAAFLDARSDIAMVGACAGKLRPDGTRKSGVRVPPLDGEAIAAWLLFRSAFQQSAVMGRADVLQRYRYDPAFPVCEDIDMFLRLQRDHKLANLPRVLVDRRLHPGQTVRERQAEIRSRKAALYGPLLERLGVAPNADDVRRHVILGKTTLDAELVDREFLPWTRAWLGRIAAANRQSRLFDDQALAMASAYVWMIACRAAAPAIGTAAAVRALASSPLPLGFVTRRSAAWFAHAVPVWVGRER